MLILSFVILFVLSFFGPSPIPVPTDALALGMVVLGADVKTVLTILIVGHVVGLFFFYHLGLSSGKLISHWESQKHLRHYKLANRLYKKFGKYSLLLCSVPLIGKPLVMTAGAFKLATRTFIFWYVLGKLVWYGTILLLFLNL